MRGFTWAKVTSSTFYTAFVVRCTILTSIHCSLYLLYNFCPNIQNSEFGTEKKTKIQKDGEKRFGQSSKTWNFLNFKLFAGKLSKFLLRSLFERQSKVEQEESSQKWKMNSFFRTMNLEKEEKPVLHFLQYKIILFYIFLV